MIPHFFGDFQTPPPHSHTFFHFFHLSSHFFFRPPSQALKEKKIKTQYTSSQILRISIIGPYPISSTKFDYSGFFFLLKVQKDP